MSSTIMLTSIMVYITRTTRKKPRTKQLREAILLVQLKNVPKPALKPEVSKRTPSRTALTRNSYKASLTNLMRLTTQSTQLSSTRVTKITLVQ